MTTDERNALNTGIASGDVQARAPLTDNEQIKVAVQEHYSKVAERATDAGCCGPEAAGDDCCGTAANGLYDLDEVAAIPAEAAAASAGCGNPTAISDLKPGETVVDLQPVFGYLHRNHEKLAENMSYLSSMPFTQFVLSKPSPLSWDRNGLLVKPCCTYRYGEVDKIYMLVMTFNRIVDILNLNRKRDI